ncbi:MAG TPA: hypothetical protein VN017_04470 [Pseudoxanthomonas sp.]|nr:hypothetical protein [Pseudoxanthomonas sp.]
MGKISEASAPAALTGLERVPALQGADDVGVPLFAASAALPRGAVLALMKPFLADTASTAAGDPGAGNVRWNHATQTSATEAYVSDTDTASGSLAALWATLNAGGFFYLQSVGTPSTWQKWQITAKSDEAGYGKLTITLQGSNGSFADNEPLLLSIQQPNPATGADRNVVTALATSGVVTVDLSLGDFFTITPTAAVTGWSFINAPPAYAVTIVLKQGATPYAVAMPSGVKWPAGTAGTFSTTANKVDELSISSTDTGATRRAVLTKDFA